MLPAMQQGEGNRRTGTGGSSRPGNAPWVVFIIALAIYLAFPARRYDGDALKHTTVFAGLPEVAASNHAWTDHYFWAWWQVVKGMAGEDFVSKTQWLVALNSVLGAATAGLTCAWLRLQGVPNRTAITGAVLIAATAGFIYHSTQTTEPIMGQFWLTAALFAAALAPGNALAVAISGICWALSTAAYQSYFVAGPMVLLITLRSWRDAAVWVGGAAVSGFGIFGLAAYLSGARDLSSFVAYLTTKHDASYWGFFSWGKSAKIPLGFIQHFAIPWPAGDWEGLRSGFPRLDIVHKALLLLQATFTLVLGGLALLVPPSERWRRLRVALLVGLVLALFPPLYLTPTYGKLWILPLWLMLVLGILVAASTARRLPWLIAALAVAVAANIPRVAIFNHSPNSPGLNAAKSIADTLGPKDLLICDGWDDVTTFRAMYLSQETVCLVQELGGAEALRRRIDQTIAGGGRVFVYGLVERTEKLWRESDLGFRPGLMTYDDFTPFREMAGEPIWTGAQRGCLGSLYELRQAPSP